MSVPAGPDPTAMVGLMPAPLGVTPDFYHTTPVQVAFMAVFGVTYTLATIALILRLYTRVFVVKSVGFDEPLLIAAWAVTLAFFVVSVNAMPAGFGRNMYEVTQTQLVGYLEQLLLLALTYIWPPTLTKLSILVLYWRISPDRIFRVCIVATAVVLIAYTATFTGLFCGPCNPLLGTPESAVCLNNIAVSQAVLNIVTDGVIIVLPIPTIHRLNMGPEAAHHRRPHPRPRISVRVNPVPPTFPFPPTPIPTLQPASTNSPHAALGIASIVRVAYVRAMVANPDVTFTQCSAAVWSLLEMNLGILCNALAALKPFVRQHMPNLFSSNGWGSGGGAGGADGKPQRGVVVVPRPSAARSRAWGAYLSAA
ncbi:hypothetical protein CHGG_07673 [Chaetomium globosum CBS 148.51]|uniref:Rhodopsin domain-containing protein n=1 Tax=Chaetomium globosum (strain ATCC 6205 / CBS 148.51 / DSM 1962 / NBRC 6347 / NRRL 1970) TaxID=306901 RepID=Q2GWI1_CHAGB|nr:uncharacterized protein CHGG_07673 [Chaetomium globosum CBS 148.51]EAQ86420.1 hypothetical protein CHGG_07673 [Chaetomium globosum CBS 148.51]